MRKRKGKRRREMARGEGNIYTFDCHAKEARQELFKTAALAWDVVLL